jgi:hypothetical protein
MELHISYEVSLRLDDAVDRNTQLSTPAVSQLLTLAAGGEHFFDRHFPDMELHISYEVFNGVWDALADDRVEVAIGATPGKWR